MNEKWLYFVGGVVLGTVVGSVGTYFTTKKKLETASLQYISDGIQEEIVKSKEFLNAHKDDESRVIEYEEETEVIEYSDIVKDEGYSEVVEFDDSDIDKNSPYVITKLMFEDDDTYQKTHLTYFEADHTLIDEDGDIIEDVANTIGKAVDNFGKLSGDPEVVYVRNERIELDFEVHLMESDFVGYTIQKLGNDD